MNKQIIIIFITIIAANHDYVYFVHNRNDDFIIFKKKRNFNIYFEQTEFHKLFNLNTNLKY